MKKFYRLIVASIVLTSSLLTAVSPDTEWENLFDGKTLKGWTRINGTAEYSVMNGMIVGTTVFGSPNSFLVTEKEYGNFILELDFKVDERLNSGIQIRSLSVPEYRDGIVHGYQVEIDPAQIEMYINDPPNYRNDGSVVPSGSEPRRWTAGIYDEKRRGWLCDLTKNETARMAFKPDEWNSLRIEAIGDGIRTWINNVPAARIVDAMTANGFIGLQVHSIDKEEKLQVRWKNIRIKDLGYNEAQYQVPKDAFIGDWQNINDPIQAQLFKNAEGIYQVHLIKSITTARLPYAVLTGTLKGKEIIFIGDGWEGIAAKKRLKLKHGDKSFELKRFRRYLPTLNEPAPPGATILFDGKDQDQWLSQKYKDWINADGPADWKILAGGRLEAIPEAGSIITEKNYSDFTMHLEFRTLGEQINGGIYLLSRYELNIKDSYGIIDSPPCCALGNVAEPNPLDPGINAALPPFHWQTLDIDFRAPRFAKDGETKIENARMSVIHNGVQLYYNVEPLKLKGAAKRWGEVASGRNMLQEHGTAYQFRNIWLLDKSK